MIPVRQYRHDIFSVHILISLSLFPCLYFFVVTALSLSFYFYLFIFIFLSLSLFLISLSLLPDTEKLCSVLDDLTVSDADL